VIAFTETPTSNGWRIRYFRSPWVFYDNPAFGPSASQHYDLQGIATHEYGHALGLDHSNSQGATMFSASLLNGTDYRTIENDDIQGIRTIYGSLSAGKPHVDTYSHLGGGGLSIRGRDFDANDNEVWFTQAGRGGDGTPVKVTGIASTAGGTELVLQVPPEAGPGDLLVKLPGGSFSALSNAFPFDTQVGPCPEPIVYGTGKVNSSNLPARIGWLGTPSLSQQKFTITLSDGPFNEWGRVFWGSGKKATPFFGGWMLTTPPKHRGARFSISAFGYATAKIKIDPSMVGQTRYYQCWYRDFQSPEGAGTSNALEITFCD
jgi:hypothetical protein